MLVQGLTVAQEDLVGELISTIRTLEKQTVVEATQKDQVQRLRKMGFDEAANQLEISNTVPF